MSCRSLLYSSLLDRQRKRWNKSCVDQRKQKTCLFVDLNCLVYFRSVVKNVSIGEKATIWSTEFGQFRKVILLFNGKTVRIFHNIAIVIDKIRYCKFKWIFICTKCAVCVNCVRMCVIASQRISLPRPNSMWSWMCHGRVLQHLFHHSFASALNWCAGMCCWLFFVFFFVSSFFFALVLFKHSRRSEKRLFLVLAKTWFRSCPFSG